MIDGNSDATTLRDPKNSPWVTCTIEGGGFVFTGYGATRRLAVKDAIVLWGESVPDEIPEKIHIHPRWSH